MLPWFWEKPRREFSKITTWHNLFSPFLKAVPSSSSLSQLLSTPLQTICLLIFDFSSENEDSGLPNLKHWETCHLRRGFSIAYPKMSLQRHHWANPTKSGFNSNSLLKNTYEFCDPITRKIFVLWSKIECSFLWAPEPLDIKSKFHHEDEKRPGRPSDVAIYPKAVYRMMLPLWPYGCIRAFGRPKLIKN